LRIEPDKAAIHSKFGMDLFTMGRVDEAVDQFRTAIQDDPDYTDARICLGNVMLSQGRPEEAIPEYEEALRLKPDNLEAQNNLAWLLATVLPGQGGDPARAVAIAQRACDLTGHRMAIQLDTLAVAYAAAGRFEEAIHTAEESMAIAGAAGQAQLVTNVQAQIDLFHAGQPYRGRTDSK
jgi:spermidine synthase